MSFESSVLDSALAENVADSPTLTVTLLGCSEKVMLSLLSASAPIGTSETSISATISKLIMRFFIMFLLNFDFSTVPLARLYTQ